MAPKKYSASGKKQPPKGSNRGSNGELAGWALAIVSAVLLLCICIPIALGPISLAIRGFIMGVFGLIAYPLLACSLIGAIALIKGWSSKVKGKTIAGIIVSTLCIIMILQLATSYMYLGNGINAYISAVYDSKVTIGGCLFGVFTYGLATALSQVGFYVLFAALLILTLLLTTGIISRVRTGGAEKVRQPRGRGRVVEDEPEPNPGFAKGYAAPAAVKPLVDNSLFVGVIDPGSAVESGNFDDIQQYQPQPLTPQQNTSNSYSNSYYDQKTEFLSYHDPQPEETTDSSGRTFKSEAHRILFGDTPEFKPVYYDVGSTSSSSSSSSSSYGGAFSASSYQYTPQYTPSSGYVSPLDGYSSPFGNEPEQPVRETPKETIKGGRPPKIVHKIPESIILPEKDISDQIVGGNIVNGDDFAQKTKEEKKRVQESDTEQQSFVDHISSKYRVYEDEPKYEEEKIVRDPIMNGDYFGKQRPAPRQEVRQEEVRREPVKSEPAIKNEPVYREPIIKSDPVYKPIKKDPPVLEIKKVSPPPAPQVTAEEEFDNSFDDDDILADGALSYDGSVDEDADEEQSFASLLESEPAIINRRGVEDFIAAEPFPEEEIEDDEEDSLVLPPVEEAKGVDTESSSFHIIDEVEDKSEYTFDVHKDHTGYYETVKEKPGFESRVNALDTKLSKKKPPAVPENQIDFTEYAKAETAEEPPKPKKRRKTNYIAPPLDLLSDMSTDPGDYGADAEAKARILENTLESLKIPAKVVGITRGPAVTRYELEIPPGIPVKRIAQFTSDIEYNLAVERGIRIETPIPGKRAVGIEVPNESIAIVALRDVIGSREFQNNSSPLTLAVGRDIAGKNIVAQMEKLPHLLIAGATGSGKSACLNSIIMSILYKASPDDVRLILIDPKQVEFVMYREMPHLLIKDIVNEPEQAINAFKWAKIEMERRYKLMSKHCVRNISEFNNSPAVKDGSEEKLPYIIIIVDELSDLMMSSSRKKDLEDKIMSMAAKARAAGLHLILATQRPSVDVITGTIKANLPSRIAFAVTSNADSRTILDSIGAETLLGRGDMLYAPSDMPEPKRVQGAFVTTEDVSAVVSYVKEHNESVYDESAAHDIMFKEEKQAEIEEDFDEGDGYDSLMRDVLRRVIESGQASTSMIQRRFSVGYARASRIIDQMETSAFIGPLEGSKPREVYITREQFAELFGEEV